jgi:hypothetical protein
MVGAAAILHYYDVSARDIAVFTAYSVFAVTLPGALIWRGLTGRSGHISTDLAAGTAIGFAIEIGVYALCRALGAPIAVIAWPLLTYAIFAAVPRLRRHWRGSGERLPIGLTVSYLALGAYMLIFSAWTLFRIEALTGQAAASTYIDVPFHLALTGELKNHFPGRIPYVTGEPLNYHWYVYAHMASASWLTGIDPLVLLLRLIGIPALAAFGVLIVSIGRTLSGRWWAGVIAVLLACCATVTSPFWWNTTAPGLSPLDYAWLSPTATFGATIFGGLALALVGVLRKTYAHRIGPLVAIALLAGGVAGAKATYLPLLVCGAMLVLLVQLLLTRRPGVIVWVLGIVAAWLAFAQFVVFGGGTEGMIVAPLITTKRSDIGLAVLGAFRSANPWPKLAVLALLMLIAWGLNWLGVIGLTTRALRRDPAVWLVFGIGFAGIAAVFLLGHPNLSQYYFVVAARPYIGLAAAVGLAALVDPGPDRSRRHARTRLWVIAAAAGVAAIYVVKLTVGRHAPEPNSTHMLIRAAVPFGVLLVILALAAAGIWIAARRDGLGRRAAAAGIAIMAMATTVPQIAQEIRLVSQFVTSSDRRDVDYFMHAMPPGGLAAMHWLRAHSGPDDIIATNEQCRPGTGPDATPPTKCDPRDFWVSGYSERRVLLEGWGYTERALMSATPYSDRNGGPYWDPALLAANDAVFTAPTAANVAALKTEHGVRWLVAVGDRVSPALGSYATLRYQAPGVAVYEIN